MRVGPAVRRPVVVADSRAPLDLSLGTLLQLLAGRDDRDFLEAVRHQAAARLAMWARIDASD